MLLGTPLAGVANAMVDAVRSHGVIESRLNRVLEMAFRQDESRARTGHAPANLVVLHKLALPLIQQVRSRTEGVKSSWPRVGWDTGHLLHLLGAA